MLTISLEAVYSKVNKKGDRRHCESNSNDGIRVGTELTADQN